MSSAQPLALPPLSLYVHIPWCVRKCPYCDFNSHAQKEALPEKAYVDALLADLRQDLPMAEGRGLHSIFIGGGTPSLFSPDAITRLLDGINQQLTISDKTEITMEANPGTTEAERFIGYRKAGVNRLSIGIQSFDEKKLQALGRIHSPGQAITAANQARECFDELNLDLMHGLPDQSPGQALDDLRQALALTPTHLSWYQLTIEPQTQFWFKPPTLPDEDALCDIEEQGKELLAEHGFTQYEISAYAKQGHQCRHNLNYWRFGDYLGIGCGAHGKLTLPEQNRVIRTSKIKHPKGYLDPQRSFTDSSWQIEPEELAIEYFMNRLRLFEAIPKQEYLAFTGQSLDKVKQPFTKAIEEGLLEEGAEHWRLTTRGQRYLNRLLGLLIEE
ncbi:radical SAM family heme chaperone HemW [Dongshaea marina]|uniref:radical SAM family heme chaperone HemW n=1 Tax=Dongshaea marina TaxID=2047966 RepID=UPI000D3E7910|nr:radical SAM family heme chaperone HemW [Dongshaea marina]